MVSKIVQNKFKLLLLINVFLKEGKPSDGHLKTLFVYYISRVHNKDFPNTQGDWEGRRKQGQWHRLSPTAVLQSAD